MSDDVKPSGVFDDLLRQIEELEKELDFPKASAEMQAAWDALDPGEPIPMPLSKIAWERLLGAVEATPVLAIQAATLALLLGNRRDEEAKTVGANMAKTAVVIQKSMQGIRYLLMANMLEAGDE